MSSTPGPCQDKYHRGKGEAGRGSPSGELRQDNHPSRRFRHSYRQYERRLLEPFGDSLARSGMVYRQPRLLGGVGGTRREEGREMTLKASLFSSSPLICDVAMFLLPSSPRVVGCDPPSLPPSPAFFFVSPFSLSSSSSSDSSSSNPFPPPSSLVS